VTDPGGNLTAYDYDLKDRIIRVRRHGVVREEYVYDKADNLLAKKDGQGRTLLTFTIGPGNLTTAVKLASGETQTLAYDQRGRLTVAATDDMEVKFAYDSLGQRIADERNGQGVKHQFAWGRRDGYVLRETTVLGRFPIRYEYAADGSVTLHDPGGKAHTIRMLGQGLIERQMANGSLEVSQFDREGRCLLKMQSRHHWYLEPSSQLYIYSTAGDLRQIEDSRQGSTIYEYDAAQRLIKEKRPGADPHRFRHDLAGNLLEKPGLKDLVLRDGNRLESLNGRKFHYNERNHVASQEGSGETVRYSYDSWDRLIRIDMPQGEWQAWYDPLGRRIRKSWLGGRVDYYWDTDRLAAEIDQSGRVRLYIYASPLALVPMLFMDYESLEADLASGQRFYPFCNQLGVPTLVEDDKAKMVWSARVHPYGDLELAPGSQLDLALRFPGHYMDAETGLHYNRFRYYSPEWGRYLQSDPIGLAGGLNLYAYPSNPLTQVDLRGLSKICRTSGQVLDEETGLPKKELTARELAEARARLARLQRMWDTGIDPETGQPLTKQQWDELTARTKGIREQMEESQRIAASKARIAAEEKRKKDQWEADNPFKIPQTGTAKKKDDIPGWVDEQRQGTDEPFDPAQKGTKEDPPRRGETPDDYAKRVCDRKYGEDNYPTGPDTEHNKIKKHVENDLKDPVYEP
jgi:RHS repeat-associated protein